MGLKRPSVVMSVEEKQLTAYHEGGHALCAYVLDNADPVHKVTILPTGMALGMTQQLPIEEQHAYNKRYIEDMLSVMLGGRVAEEVVFKNVSTGAQNDLVRATEIARKMVREWGMSDRIGPMAWGSQGAVFLGDDLMHTRDYSDETARVIDEEVEAILREQEQRTVATLTKYRPALDAIAQGLLDHETLDGDDITRLADTAMGFKAGGARTPVQPDTVTPDPTPAPVIADAPVPAAEGAPNGNGSPPTGQYPPPPPVPPARPPFTPA
jgi:cell division protease FtsH